MPATVPDAPTIGTATFGNGQATVAFTAPASNGGDTITSYTATSTPGNFTGIVSQAGSGSITVTGLTNGTSYTFKVKATNAVGTGSESAASNSVIPDAIPVNVSVTPSSGSAPVGVQQTFTSTFSDADGYADLTTVRLHINTDTTDSGVELQYKQSTNSLAMKDNTGALSSWVVLGSATPIDNNVATLDCQNTTVTTNGNNMVVTWKVTFKSTMVKDCILYGYSADTKSVNSGFTNLGTCSIINQTVPGAPTIRTATRGNGQATVAFTAPASDGGSAITSYTATSTPGNFTGTVSQAGSGSITVTGLTNGTAYTFKVKATNAIGTGSESAASNSVTPATVPGIPTIGTATFGNTQATVAFTAPASNGGSTITSYTATSTPGNITGYVSQSGSGSITVTGLTNGTSYTFKVKATNSVGTGSESAASNSVIPDAVPVNVSVTPSSGSATIGTQQTFTSTFSDADGYADLTTVRLHINTDTTDSGVELQYKQSTNSLAMKDNTGALSSWVVLGSATPIDNNVATLDCANTTVTTNGNNMVVTWKVTLKSPMNGKNCNLYGYSADAKSVNSGFTNLGTCSITSTVLAEYNFNLESSYSANSPTGHWRNYATGGTLSGTAFTDITFAPTVGTIDNTAVNWEQVTGNSGGGSDYALGWAGKGNSTHYVYASSTATTSNSEWFTSTRNTLTISAKVKFNQLRYGTPNAQDQNHIFAIGIGQSGDTSQNLFHINAVVFSNRYPGGGTNPGGNGSPYLTVATDSISTYISDGTIGSNSAVTSNVGAYGTADNTVANWRGYAGVTVMKNDASNYKFMTQFAERGNLNGITPTVTAQSNAVAIAAAGPDGVAGNTDDWYLYTISIDFSAGDTATYKVYIGNQLQATMVQNLPTGIGSAYWTVRDLRIGANNYFTGAIDDIKITDQIDVPL